MSSAKNCRTSAKSAAWSVTGASRPPAKAAGGAGRLGIAPASLEQVEPRAVGRGIGQVVAGPGQDAAAEVIRVADQVAGQRRLADTRFAAEKDEPAMPAAGRGELLAQNILLPRPADEERWRTQGSNAGSTGGAVRPHGDVVHVCPIAVASCPEIVPIRRCVCIDGPQREDNATWDVHMVARLRHRQRIAFPWFLRSSTPLTPLTSLPPSILSWIPKLGPPSGATGPIRIGTRRLRRPRPPSLCAGRRVRVVWGLR